jgi:peptide/nickel transport system permease protein
MIIAWGVALPLGVLCAWKENSKFDKFIQGTSFLSMSLPTFFMAFLFLFFAAKLNLLPKSGLGGALPGESTLEITERIKCYLQQLFIPVSVLVIAQVPYIMRLMRANLLEVLSSLYIRAACAKGLSFGYVLFKHGFRNALNPLITIMGMNLPGLISGAGLTEIITSYPGLGRLILEAYQQQDIYVVMASLLFSSFLLLLGNLLADIALAINDPTLRLGKRVYG